MSFMQITIGGMPGAGKSTKAKMIAKRLKLRFYSMGNIMRKMAAKRGMTINEYMALKEDIDSEIDNYQKKIGQEEDNFVLEGRLAFHFIPKSIKIFFDADKKEAAKRIFRDQRTGSEKHYSSLKESLSALNERIKSDKARYKKLYGIDAYDKKNFDYVIDTTKLGPEENTEKVISLIRKHAKKL